MGNTAGPPGAKSRLALNSGSFKAYSDSWSGKQEDIIHDMEDRRIRLHYIHGCRTYAIKYIVIRDIFMSYVTYIVDHCFCRRAALFFPPHVVSSLATIRYRS